MGKSSSFTTAISSALYSSCFSASCFLFKAICCFNFSILLKPVLGRGGGSTLTLGATGGGTVSCISDAACVTGFTVGVTTVFSSTVVSIIGV
jgi:hypothetical protein